MKNLTASLAVLMLIFVGLACSGLGDETDKANAMVDEANKFITEGNKNLEDASTKGKEFDKMVTDAEGNKDEQQKIIDFGNKELIPLYDKMKDNFQKAADKFDAASKLKVKDKFKEYLEAKSAEFKKRAEYAESLKAIPNTLAKSKSKEDYNESVKKDVDNSQKLLKEAKDLGDKATKIQTDNPTIFKKE
jgi:Holliday junction resolvase RusA-like endonuclease